MSERAYMLLESLGQIVYEMEGIIDLCNADERLAVTHCVSELRGRSAQLQRCMDRLSPLDADEDDDADE